MATKEDSLMELHEIIIESEGSNSNSEWDDSEEDPDYDDMLEETHRSFSNLSLKNKSKKRIVENKGMDSAMNSEVLEMNTPSVDGDSFDKVQKIIK
ncbi:hypothetical protein TSUD_358890, partial [Trifolium subterraneum]